MTRIAFVGAGSVEFTRDLLGDIFTRAASRFNNPANLKRLIDLIDETRWTTLEIDIKAAELARRARCASGRSCAGRSGC